MRLLLDTHVFLWFVWAAPELSSKARALIEDPVNQVFVSMASLWEIAIKVSIGKLKLARPLGDFLTDRLDGGDFEILPIERAHIVRLPELSLHHRDPFDRMLIAQATVERMPIVSVDAAFDAYGITRIW